ncbi:hypothetical protein [Streptomyces sp. WAC01280]|uniref:hypothetical protein n=1 Tax=Streptomyces sp. WAC01280 TaxID=2487424 RepID=UPI000F787ED3|nr:hypothetical protein [Streptomyces sp. WAC01280]RSS60010.1 hypothetical protein EF909_09230 [Streptomyces sp. WAC01280]
MSQEAAPERAVPEQSAPQSVPAQKDAGAPKGLLQQMEELMAALSADLSQLDADIQSTADRLESEPTEPGPDSLVSEPGHPGTDHPDADYPTAGHPDADRPGTADRLGTARPAAEHDGSAPYRSDVPAPEHRDTHQNRSDQRGHGAEHREDAGHEPDTRPASGDATRPLF